MGAERDRLRVGRDDADPIAANPWRRWGPFVSAREWGTVREDYSADGEAWGFVSHDEARSYAYRWGEDGIAAICDRRQGLCLGVALWNGVDPILKERLFGLTGKEGNHGEDVKERYWHVDATPTHSWLRFGYQYPQDAFPYADLIEENARRGADEPEYELADTGVLDRGWWAVEIDHAKATPDDLCLRIRATNHGGAPAELHVLPTLWLRNVWAWGRGKERSSLRGREHEEGHAIVVDHPTLGEWVGVAGGPGVAPHALFCENETNTERLYGVPNRRPYPKDGIDDHVVSGGAAATVSPEHTGTKAAWWGRGTAGPGETLEWRVRLTKAADPVILEADLGAGFDAVLADREREADEFWAETIPPAATDDEAMVARAALAGLLWSQQFYRYDVGRWLDGDPTEPAPPAGRDAIRNGRWRHLDASDVICMPDTWEYPWFASWDLAFHAVALAEIDPDLAKQQLLLLLQVWYQHPNGALPAYEWSFSDANPPVHAWAARRVFQLDGSRDRAFLERAFQKLLLNFTWWVNREDAEGDNVFEGGFLGLDNIGPFNRSEHLPVGGRLEQSDATGWMARYCLDLLDIALTLAVANPVYEDLAVKFFEHFAAIARAMNETGLWSEEDGLFYDVVRLDDGTTVPLRVRSMVGLIPLLAVTVITRADLDALPLFTARTRWFLQHQPTAAGYFGRFVAGDGAGPADGSTSSLLSVVSPERLARLLATMLDETEFLSPHGLRSLSRRHLEHPVHVELGGAAADVAYEPAESSSGLFGGNSNWRGPVWFPLNFLTIEALRDFHRFTGDAFTVELPTGSGRPATLPEVADDLARRLVSIFLADEATGARPVDGPGDRSGGRSGDRPPQGWPEQPWFFEYFHGDTGTGLGASHQTGWTALVASLILDRARARSAGR